MLTAKKYPCRTDCTGQIACHLCLDACFGRKAARCTTKRQALVVSRPAFIRKNSLFWAGADICKAPNP